MNDTEKASIASDITFELTSSIAAYVLDITGLVVKPEFHLSASANNAFAAGYAIFAQALANASPAQRAKLTIEFQEHEAFCKKLLTKQLAEVGITWPLSA